MLNNTKHILSVAFISCGFIVVVGWLWQWSLDLPSCSKCVFQRYLFVGAGLGFLLASFVASWARIHILLIVWCLTIYGFDVAAGQVLAKAVDVSVVFNLLNSILLPTISGVSFLLLAVCCMYCGLREFNNVGLAIKINNAISGEKEK